jgi:two-component system response regulator BaeR
MTSKHILIVEDEEKIARLLSDYLKKAGHRTSTQSNGDCVIAQIKKNPPDLILLDIMLPGKNGMELCREIRQFSNIPIMRLPGQEIISTVYGVGYKLSASFN